MSCRGAAARDDVPRVDSLQLRQRCQPLARLAARGMTRGRAGSADWRHWPDSLTGSTIAVRGGADLAGRGVEAVLGLWRAPGLVRPAAERDHHDAVRVRRAHTDVHRDCRYAAARRRPAI